MNNPMDSGFPGIYEQPNGFRDFQDSRNNPVPGLSFSRNSQTAQGWLQLFQVFTNNSMASGCGEDLRSQSLQDL
jgi:hypothetical protein